MDMRNTVILVDQIESDVRELGHDPRAGDRFGDRASREARRADRARGDPAR